MLGRPDNKDEIVNEVVTRLERMNRVNPSEGAKIVNATEALSKNIEELRGLLDLHLQIARVRVGLEESTLGATETLMKALTNLIEAAKTEKLLDEVARKADMLVKAMRVAEQKGLLSQLCEKAIQGLVPRVTTKTPKANYFGTD